MTGVQTCTLPILHFGTLGGLPTKILWFLFGAILTALSVTGVLIYSQRLAKESGTPDRKAALAWRGTGRWGYVGVALILLSLALTPGAIHGAG